MESKFEGKVAESKVGDRDGVTVPAEDGWILPGAGEDPSVIARAALWFGKKGKLKMLTDFAKDNYHVFEDVIDREDDGAGLSFEHEECHKQFLELFEEQLESFIEEEGFELEQFEKEAEDLRSGKSLTLFDSENEEHKKFLDTLLSSLDFEHFFKIMVDMARNQNRRKSASHKNKNKK